MPRTRLRLAAAALGALLGAAALATASETPPEHRAFVETVGGEGTVVVGEPVRLVLRIGYDRPWFEAHGVPLFHQAMDVPLQVDAPWLRELSDAVPAPAGPRAPDAGARATIAVNGEVTEARRAPDVVRDGRAYAVLEVERTWRPGRAGGIALAGPTIRFAHATAFREDLVHGRTALDAKDVVVRGTARDLRIVPLPEVGRPPGFSGAVGRYTVRAETTRTEVRVGEVFPVRLVVEGEGNLDLLPPPGPGDLPGFHVYGTLDENGPGRRTLTYDVAALREDLRAVPGIPFAWYDPGPPGGYRVARTAPIPLVVRPGTPPPHAPAAPPAAAGRDLPRWVVPVAGLGLVALVAAIVAARRSRRRRAARDSDPHAARWREALEAFHAAAARPGADLAEPLALVLATRLRCPRAAVVGPDLCERLVASGLAPDLSARAATALEALVASRYGGDPFDPAAATAVVREIASLDA